MKVFIDTWGWIALFNKREFRHDQVSEFYKEFRKKRGLIYTSSDVLNETFTSLFRHVYTQQAFHAIEVIDEAVKTNYLMLEWITELHFEKAKELRRRFSDKPLISFTDLTSMVIMENQGITDILTEDDHFLQVGLGFKTVPEVKKNNIS